MPRFAAHSARSRVVLSVIAGLAISAGAAAPAAAADRNDRGKRGERRDRVHERGSWSAPVAVAAGARGRKIG
jgi:hypothetical protein